ncbi:hypothetical protein GTW43_09270 [Streptomyces sp. SID5785]|uniref:Ser-Thr-rich GPI-anchored membrane family protein n=1 Tax=Streptomyces sp. SID5785 TaxID=2690309 RepID=UPI001361547E|nr:Ser-Thr-rich GPI-anchored membrane family protein [Streptomyces sp. SID5785]MZD05269.1 hypothetical protein [Streptomyces sp. SID5785]
MRRAGFLSLAVLPLLALAPAPASDPGVSVTAPAAASVHPAGGTLFVRWRNETGQELDMWLVRGETDRVVRLSSKLSGATAGETATVLPPVPDGDGYAIELSNQDGSLRGYSGTFAVGPPPRAVRGPGASGAR